MEIQVLSPRMRLALFLLFEALLGGGMWLVWRDQPAPHLEDIGNVGALLSWLPPLLHLYYKFQTKGTQRWQWQVPDSVGFVLGWAGFLVRQEAVAENSWTLSNRGSILETLGGLAVIYALVVLFPCPKTKIARAKC